MIKEHNKNIEDNEIGVPLIPLIESIVEWTPQRQRYTMYSGHLDRKLTVRVTMVIGLWSLKCSRQAS